MKGASAQRNRNWSCNVLDSAVDHFRTFQQKFLVLSFSEDGRTEYSEVSRMDLLKYARNEVYTHCELDAKGKDKYGGILQARDVRVLDPQVDATDDEPSILSRRHAIVIKLSDVRMLVLR